MLKRVFSFCNSTNRLKKKKKKSLKQPMHIYKYDCIAGTHGSQCIYTATHKRTNNFLQFLHTAFNCGINIMSEKKKNIYVYARILAEKSHFRCASSSFFFFFYEPKTTCLIEEFLLSSVGKMKCGDAAVSMKTFAGVYTITLPMVELLIE